MFQSDLEPLDLYARMYAEENSSFIKRIRFEIVVSICLASLFQPCLFKCLKWVEEALKLRGLALQK